MNGPSCEWELGKCVDLVSTQPDALTDFENWCIHGFFLATYKTVFFVDISTDKKFKIIGIDNFKGMPGIGLNKRRRYFTFFTMVPLELPGM